MANSKIVRSEGKVIEPDSTFRFGLVDYNVYDWSTLEKYGIIRNTVGGVAFTMCPKCNKYAHHINYSASLNPNSSVWVCEDCLNCVIPDKIVIWE